jgi:hypothetical protein
LGIRSLRHKVIEPLVERNVKAFFYDARSRNGDFRELSASPCLACAIVARAAREAAAKEVFVREGCALLPFAFRELEWRGAGPRHCSRTTKVGSATNRSHRRAFDRDPDALFSAYLGYDNLVARRLFSQLTVA